MAFSIKLLIVIISLSTWTVTTMVMARPLSSTSTPSTSTTLATRLRLEGANNKCWETLFQLQACTGEMIMFFLNGETNLGSGCCHALLTVAQECWPDMLTTLGLTQQEGDILRGYCDGAPNNNKSVPSSATVNASHPMSNNNNDNNQVLN